MACSTDHHPIFAHLDSRQAPKYVHSAPHTQRHTRMSNEGLHCARLCPDIVPFCASKVEEKTFKVHFASPKNFNFTIRRLKESEICASLRDQKQQKPSRSKFVSPGQPIGSPGSCFAHPCPTQEPISSQQRDAVALPAHASASSATRIVC